MNDSSIATGSSQDTFVRVSHKYSRELMPKLSGSAWKVLTFLLDRTQGWTQPRRRQTYEQIMDGTGVGSRSTIIKAIRELEGHRAVLRERPNGRLGTLYYLDVAFVQSEADPPLTYRKCTTTEERALLTTSTSYSTFVPEDFVQEENGGGHRAVAVKGDPGELVKETIQRAASYGFSFEKHQRANLGRGYKRLISEGRHRLARRVLSAVILAAKDHYFLSVEEALARIRGPAGRVLKADIEGNVLDADTGELVFDAGRAQQGRRGPKENKGGPPRPQRRTRRHRRHAR